MNLNTDIRKLVRRDQEKRPAKRTMNLYFKEDRTTAPATALLYILFALVVVLGLSKVLVYDRFAALWALEDQAAALERQIQSQQETLARFSEVEREYLRRAPTEEELAQADRMAILDLIDGTLRPAATVDQVTISGSSVLVRFSQVTLEEAAGLVNQLSQSPLVGSIRVDTAASTQDSQDLVEVTVYMETAGEEGDAP